MGKLYLEVLKSNNSLLNFKKVMKYKKSGIKIKESPLKVSFKGLILFDEYWPTIVLEKSYGNET